MPICIYCRDELGTEHFNREHVIPLQFGAFENNQTLVNSVCRECNAHFGRTLENALGRNSFEAIFRLRHGQKLRRDFVGFADDRLSFRIPASKRGAGMVVTPKPDPDGTDLMLLIPSQVGIQRQGQSEFQYYTEEELRSDGSNLLPAGTKVTLRLVTGKEDDAGLERLRELVRTFVPKFEEEGEVNLPPLDRSNGEIIVEICGTIDKMIARAVAKIAFNYMAKHVGVGFALNSSFDPIRRFIRHDEGGDDWRQFVRILNKPLLAEETVDLRVTRGHIAMLGWPTIYTLQVQVSPYNSIAYQVTMTTSFSGVWRPIKVGHVFDWEHRVIHELQSVGAITLPRGWAQQSAMAYAAIAGRPRDGHR
jgi:hypothetical protein